MARSLPLLRSRQARWGVPVAVLALVAVGIGLGTTGAVANPGLAPKTAGELLAAVADAPKQPFSGTVVETANLGLPALPDSGGSTSPQALLTGSHTLRIWFASPKQVRLALIGDLAETDLIRNGTDVWLWSSRSNTATHSTLPSHQTATPSPTTLPVDPLTAAQQALAAIDPTTAVTVDGTNTVAGRSVYELVLAPRDPASLIGQVRLALDSATYLPLSVQVYAKAADGAVAQTPSFETGFTSLQPSTPDASLFSFTPPPGATVTEQSPSMTGQSGTPPPSAPTTAPASAPTVVGTGWMSVLVLHGVTASSLSSNATLGTLLKATTPVSGPFGSGQLLTTPLVSVLMLSDGRTLVGAVQPSVLEQAAATATTGTATP